MTFKQAIAKSLTVRWKVSFCPQGEKCWCRVIEPEEQIIDDDGEQIHIAPSGSIAKDHAEHIVRVHNSYFNESE